MVRRGVGALVLWLVVAMAAGLPAAVAKPTPPTTQPPPPAVPPTYIVVDAASGAVVAQADARTPRLPASTIKLMTALIAAERLPPGDSVPISALAEAMPARKINVKAGQVWSLKDLMHCLLMISANDAAVAVAERTAGSLQEWTKLAQQTATRLGLADKPVFGDPAGLDDEFAQGGGSMISARDLAIVARAVLARPDLMAIIGTKQYSFTGGDGVAHRFTNHNLFLGMYDGAIGMKTGTTRRAGSTFVGAATRGGRTMIVVELNAPDAYRQAALLLDQAFAVPAGSQPAGGDVLPPVVKDASSPPSSSPSPSPSTTAPAAALALAPAASNQPAATSSLDINSVPVAAAIFMVGMIALVLARKALFGRGEPVTDHER